MIITKELQLYLKDLSKNNNRDWFHQNKKRYETNVKKPFYNLITELAQAQGYNLQAKDAVFRINRDIRFSKDKSPYKTNVGAIISEYGRKGKEQPGFYIHIETGSLMIGGGSYFVDKDALQKIRQHIQNNLSTFNNIINNKDFVEKFGNIKGDKNVRIPKEFKETAEQQALIANKQFYFMAELAPDNVVREDLVSFIVSYFKAGQPLNDFLQEAIQA